jgi:hypothetical protein
VTLRNLIEERKEARGRNDNYYSRKLWDIMSKVILLDASVFAFKSIFNFEMMLKNRKNNDFLMPVEYTYFSTIISCLKKINVEENTKVILSLDDKSWRKNYLADYKSQRKAAREKHTLIDWNDCFERINKMNQQLNYATNFHVLRIPNCESDDIIATACRVFKDCEVVIASIDADLQMLCFYPNVKFFSGNFKVKGSRGGYIYVENPLGILDKKCRLGDVSDNIVVNKATDDVEDANLRKFIINLLELPQEIELAITEVLQNLPDKQGIKWEELPFKNSLGKRFEEIYNPIHKVSPEYCYALKEKRTKLKKKKEADKRKEKKNESVSNN